MSAPDPGADQDLMAAGKMWEDNGDYSKAIDSYLKVCHAKRERERESERGRGHRLAPQGHLS
jgi:hypothetical protein